MTRKNGAATLAARLALALALAAGLATGAPAHEPHVDVAGALKVEGAWARPAASGNGAAYMTLGNGGDEPDRLLRASAPVADTVELHAHEIDAQGVARMRPVVAVEVPPGGEAALAPGGLHLMLVGLKEPLREGESFELTLDFERAGEVTVDVAVARQPPQGSAAGHGGGGAHTSH